MEVAGLEHWTTQSIMLTPSPMWRVDRNRIMQRTDKNDKTNINRWDGGNKALNLGPPRYPASNTMLETISPKAYVVGKRHHSE